MALQTMYPAKNNSPATALTEGITAESTSMKLYDASVLPAAPNICVIGNDDTAEIVIYTGISGNTVTGLGRGVNGTIAKAWPVDTHVARNITTYDHEAFRANITALDNSKQNNLTFDTTPTADSANPVTSGGIKTALDTKQDTLTFDQTPTPSSTNPVESGGVYEAIEDHAPFLITGTASAGSAVTITDTRINSEHWRVPENGITFGTPTNVTTGGTWTTNVENHTITINATFTGATTVTINMVWFQ